VIDDEVERLRLLLQNVHQVEEPSALARFAHWIVRGEVRPKAPVKPVVEPVKEKQPGTDAA